MPAARPVVFTETVSGAGTVVPLAGVTVSQPEGVEAAVAVKEARVPPPLLERVRVWEAGVEPVSPVKVKEVGERPMVGPGFTVKVPVWLEVPRVAVMVTGVEVVTARVVTVKVAVVAVAGTVTVAGTVATEGVLLVRVTMVPPVGAAALKVTVPVEGLPPMTVAGLTETVLTVVGTVSVRVTLTVWGVLLAPGAAMVMVPL